MADRIAKRGGATFWILSVVLALFVLSGALIFVRGLGMFRRRDAAPAVAETPAKGPQSNPEPAQPPDASVPVYPGAHLENSFAATGTAEGEGSVQYEFTTPDLPEKVMDYYHATFEKAGMTMALHTITPDGGMLVAQDRQGKVLNVIVEKSGTQTGIRLTVRKKL